MTNIEKLTNIGILGLIRLRMGASSEDDPSADLNINRLTNFEIAEQWTAWKLGDGVWWRRAKLLYDRLEEYSSTAKRDSVVEKAKAVQDEYGHWYVIPADAYNNFLRDLNDSDMAESGAFDDRWGNYRTGGDLNLKELWAKFA